MAKLTKEEKIARLEAEIQRIKNGEEKTDILYENLYFCITEGRGGIRFNVYQHIDIRRKGLKDYRAYGRKFSIMWADPDEMKEAFNDALNEYKRLLEDDG